MATATSAADGARETFVNDDGELFVTDGNNFWWTRKGQIIRWSIFFGLFALLMAFWIIAYMHAKRRIRKGLVPLRYHRWLLNREQRARYDPSYQNPSVYYNTYRPQGYGLNSMPPPMYNSNEPMPPTYQPPAGATKVDPSQWRSEPTRRPAESGEPTPDYEAPPGPPPAAVQANHTGSSNNPYRL